MADTIAEPQADVDPVARIAALAEAGVRLVRVGYPDLHGIARGKDIPVGDFADIVAHGIAFCEAVMTVDLRHNVVAGFEHGFQDIVARPDLSTLVQIPWEPSLAWVMADLERIVTGEPYAVDPRGALRRAVSECAALGYAPVVAPELEFYLFERSPDAPLGFRRYVNNDSAVYTAGDVSDPRGVVRDMLTASVDLGLGAFAANHEFGRAQYEINIKHTGALESADRAFRFKWLVKEFAAREGLVATFMGKPWNDDEGSGFHLHLSLAGEDGSNALADEGGADGLSDVARHFLAGVLDHGGALMALFNPTVNAYRRIIPEALVPTRVNWGHDNRFCFVRVPKERGGATRLEIRVGDGTANPYLAYAAALHAGVDGVRRGLEPPAPLQGNIYELPEAAQGQELPISLPRALDLLEADTVLARALGEELVGAFLTIKRHEYDRYRRWVSDWEFAEYSHHL